MTTDELLLVGVPSPEDKIVARRLSRPELIATFNEIWAARGVTLVCNPAETLLPANVQARGFPCVLHYPKSPPIPIDDLVVDESGISATLSFERTPHATRVPWECVHALMPLGDHPKPQPKPRPKLSLVP